jgi:hypothetical protein
MAMTIPKNSAILGTDPSPHQGVATRYLTSIANASSIRPHGSPLLMHVGADLLEKQFGWR